MDKYMERQLDDVIYYAKQKAECVVKFKEIQQKLRSIRLFEIEIGLPSREKKMRYYSYSKMLHDYFDIVKSYDRMFKRARKDFTSDVDTISKKEYRYAG